jgi:hypothetical protein
VSRWGSYPRHGAATRAGTTESFSNDLDQAGIDGKTFSADQFLTDAAPQDRETAMSVLRERRMVRHIAIEAKATEPAVCQIEMDLIAQPPLRADAEAIASPNSTNRSIERNR